MADRPRRRVALALGANLGPRSRTLRAAVAALVAAPDLHVVDVSPVYETEPVGGPPQPHYLNAVLIADTVSAPRALLTLAHTVEDAFGRTRAQRWGPRTLDVDLLAVGDLSSADPDLTLPHPRLAERAFVLRPWADVDPTFVVPGLGPVEALLAALLAATGRSGPPGGAGLRRTRVQLRVGDGPGPGQAPRRSLTAGTRAR